MSAETTIRNVNPITLTPFTPFKDDRRPTFTTAEFIEGGTIGPVPG
jgi:hypothetical protein